MSFIDEIHRIPKFIEEILYPAMEDFLWIWLLVLKGQVVQLKLIYHLLLVGATTRAGDISAPLRIVWYSF